MRVIDPTLTGGMPGDFLSRRFRESRKHARLTQAQAAEKIGLSLSAISKIERGSVTMVSDPTTLVRAARAYGVSDVWLYAGATCGERFVPDWYEPLKILEAA